MLFRSLQSNFQKIVPDYCYRFGEDGYSNASACGNEVASEQPMVRKFMIDSLCYWAKEYHIDGFRFDLMGIHDIETMNQIRIALDSIRPNIILYGEGWTGGPSPLSENERAIKSNTYRLDRIASFSDDFRDTMKGHVFYQKVKGFVNGEAGLEERVKFSVVGATKHPQVLAEHFWAKDPTQVVNYVSAHDNLTLWDKLAITNSENSIQDRKKMNRLAAAIVMTSQGIPFFQAGEELLRSKQKENIDAMNELSKANVLLEEMFVENSYNSSDQVNSIKWNNKSDYQDIFSYYKGLIAFRKTHSQFRMYRSEDVINRIRFHEIKISNRILYTIDTDTLVCYNANSFSNEIEKPLGEWNVLINAEDAGNHIINKEVGNTVIVESISALVLIKAKTNS